jgi:hypothetical protein
VTDPPNLSTEFESQTRPEEPRFSQQLASISFSSMSDYSGFLCNICFLPRRGQRRGIRDLPIAKETSYSDDKNLSEVSKRQSAAIERVPLMGMKTALRLFP